MGYEGGVGAGIEGFGRRLAYNPDVEDDGSPPGKRSRADDDELV